MNSIGAGTRAVIWRRILDDKSFELATLAPLGDGYRIAGQALLAEAGVPMRVDYQILCDRHWRTRAAEVCQVLGGDMRRLAFVVEGSNWRCNGAAMPELNDCTDIDLGISPSTNALPINRLGLAVGETKAIRAAWVRFPEFDVVAAGQSYERLEGSRYRYRSLSSDFTALLDVDDLGLPIIYEKIWVRIAVADGAAAALFPGGGNLAG
ncbi:MAG TPA: putative glycolipid-binding domain-containing protein [Rhizomicrobium sp.]|nr:putative glycolipid-binding domain-containing protein [Rhizomicrobium sp.]